ncbi:hypothetical protein [Moorena sp. SIO3A2]|nr:hypothetical protein [Moorena sp. SIO3A2]NEP50629.1 hypothetical protein [Moorena sp. SIO3C2]NER91300.1 hypothetical protein [Moorena sp. SIO3A2]
MKSIEFYSLCIQGVNPQNLLAGLLPTLYSLLPTPIKPDILVNNHV